MTLVRARTLENEPWGSEEAPLPLGLRCTRRFVGHRILDADEIVPGLWQGSLPKPGGLVQSAGFQTLVLCAREYQLPKTDFPGVTVIHAPNDDHSAFPLDRDKLQVALNAAHEVAQAVREGQQVLVTCAAGLNRSGLVSGLTLHLLFGWPGVKCVARVRKYRPNSKVHPGHGALGNGEFVRALEKLGQSLPESEPLKTRLTNGRTALWTPR